MTASGRDADVESRARGAAKVKRSTSRATDASQAEYPEIGTARAILLVFILTLCMVLNIGSVQSAVIAVPVISRDLDIRVSEQQWLSSAYAVAFGSTLLLFGRLADLYGAKKVFSGGLVSFCAFQVGAGFAQSKVALIVLRAFQGVSMAAAIPAALGILGRTFPPGQAKSSAFSCFSAGAPLGGATGAVLGGLLTQFVSWRSIFWVFAGCGAVVLVAGWLLIPADTAVELKNRTIDWIGALLTVSGLCLFTFALADGSSAPQGWQTPYVPTLLVVGILLLVCFWFWERRLEKRGTTVPLMRTRLWFKGRFALVMLLACLGWCSFASFQFFATLYYQEYLRLTPILATVRFLPSPITGLFLNLIVAILASIVPGQWLLFIGAVGTALAPTLFAVQNVSDPYWQWQFPAFILAVFGADFVYAIGSLYVSKVSGHDEQALAGGLFNCLTQVGTALGLAVNSEIQSKIISRELGKLGRSYDPDTSVVPPDIVLLSQRGAFWGCAAFGYVAALIALFGLYGIGRVGDRTAKSTKVVDKLAKKGQRRRWFGRRHADAECDGERLKGLENGKEPASELEMVRQELGAEQSKAQEGIST